MRVLSFDTATSATTVALLDANGTPRALELTARDDPPPGARPGHARRLLALIEEVMGESGGGWEQIDRLAVGVGPGTFTGLRIGVATAHALARARNLPLVGVSSLAALALAAHRSDPAARIVALIDARRGQAFAAAWGAGEDPRTHAPRLKPSVLGPEQLEQTLHELGPGVLCVGDGAIKFEPVLTRAGVRMPPHDALLHRISAREHARLARGLVPGDPNAVQPAYLRLPDAELARRR
jgi:tRNA threonylcarbamoyladenosine biosynthesis protein TsaB